MTDTVGFAWWMPAHGGTQQAFVRNYAGIEAAGHDVHAYTAESMPQMLARAEAFDWALVPFVYHPEWIERLSAQTHVHLQVGGYGADDFDAAERAIDAADSVSALDPGLARDFPVGDAPWIPNPPNADLFDVTDSAEGHVLLAKQAPGGGLGEYRDVVEEHPEETFLVLGDSFPDPPANVRIHPKVPWSWMPHVYADARAVVNIAPREGLPNVAFEAFLTSTPYVALHEDAIGVTQRAPDPPVDQTRRACSAVETGGTTFTHWVPSLEQASPQIGANGREWVERWTATDWGWPEKVEAIREVVNA